LTWYLRTTLIQNKSFIYSKQIIVQAHKDWAWDFGVGVELNSHFGFFGSSLNHLIIDCSLINKDGRYIMESRVIACIKLLCDLGKAFLHSTYEMKQWHQVTAALDSPPALTFCNSATSCKARDRLPRLMTFRLHRLLKDYLWDMDFLYFAEQDEDKFIRVFI
jgi:hypothetical protein